MERLVGDAHVIAGHFALEFKAIEPERANVKSRYGICYDDGTIRIRLNHVVSGQPLKYSSLVSTLCHELAHLRHFNHGPQFRAFNQEVLAWARKHGIYQPGNARPTSPNTLPLDPEAPDLRELIRTGRVPSLRDSLEGVLAPRPGPPGTKTAAAPPAEAASAPSQLELFAGF
jgi:hypothetical protein